MLAAYLIQCFYLSVLPNLPIYLESLGSSLIIPYIYQLCKELNWMVYYCYFLNPLLIKQDENQEDKLWVNWLRIKMEIKGVRLVNDP